VSLGLSTPVMADDFVITSGTTTNNGETIDGGDTVSVTGRIDTGTTANKDGIETTGSNTISVSTNGTIVTGGDLSNGIFNSGDNNTTTVSGSIRTAGLGAKGILIEGSTNTTNVSGSIATGNVSSNSGGNSYGIFNIGNSNTTTLSGNITTINRSGYGIYNLGNKNTTIMSGSITSSGIYDSSNYGIYNRGDENITTMSGSISTVGSSSYGIRNSGDNNKTTLSGSITTEDSSAYGILNSGDNNTTTVSVSGSIKTLNTRGTTATGIRNMGSTNTTNVSGSITTGGRGADGILNYGDNNTITVSGSIKTAGEDAHGIENTGSTNTTNVSGSITTGGIDAHGIFIRGNEEFSLSNDGGFNTTTISGTVKATGARSAALYIANGSDNSFTLNEGAIIIGDILAKDATNIYDAINSKLIFNLGASTSYAYSVSGKGAGTGAGQWTFSDLDGRSQVVTTSGSGCDTTITGAGNDTCNLVTAIGAANAEVQNELQYITSTSLINSLRLDTPMNTSQEETTATDVWFNVYGVSTERDASTWDTTGVVFNADTHGLTIGKPLFLRESFGLDLVFNYSQTDLDAGITKHQNITADSFNFGVVVTDFVSSNNWDIDAFGFIGFNSYDGKRKVMNNQVSTGSETATSSYSGTKALVGFNADYTSSINEAVSFKGGINANLSNEAIGAYSESKYSSWNARRLSQATTGISAGFTYKRDLLTTFVTLGAEYSSLLNGETAAYFNNSTAIFYTDHDASDDMVSEVAVGFKYVGASGVSFEGSIKDSSSDKGLSSTSANFGLNWEF
jgi:hypothetical protein